MIRKVKKSCNQTLKGIQRVITLMLLLVFVSEPGSVAQISSGGNPNRTGLSYSKDKFVKMAAIKSSELEIIKEYTLPVKNQPFQFAYPFAVDLNPENSGEWQTLDNGDRIWRLGITSEGAYSLNLIFGSFKLPEGAELFIYDPQKRWILGAFTSKNNKQSGILATQPVPGDEIIVEYFLPVRSGEEGRLSIGQVAHDFTGIFAPLGMKDGQYGKSGACNVDINCLEGDGWQKEKNATARFVINGIDLCTGVLLNNTAENAIPYMLTAQHCVEDSADAVSTVAIFEYESPYCDGPDGFINHSISGVSIIASKPNLDFSLIKLSKTPPIYYHPYYAGWNNQNIPPDESVCIHHPMGDVKKISIDLDAAVTASYNSFDPNTAWKVLQWDVGTTEAGSSGAPLFDNLKRVVGHLSGGEAKCGSSINDYFQKFSSSWNKYSPVTEQIKVWLDPLNLGFASLNGFDPYGPAKENCDTVKNFENSENLVLYEYGTGAEDGYWTGHNSDSITQYAEKISVSNQHNFVGAYIHVGLANSDAITDSVIFKIWAGNIQPETVIISKAYPLNYFHDSMDFYISFDSIIELTSDFWFGYEIQYDNPVTSPLTDQFALFQVEIRSTPGTNTAFFYNNSWFAFNSDPMFSNGASLGVRIVMCGETPSVGIRPDFVEDISDQVILYPNPSPGNLFIDLPGNFFETIRIRIFSLTGILILDQKINNVTESIAVDLSYLSSGIYIIRIDGNGLCVNKKLSIID